MTNGGHPYTSAYGVVVNLDKNLIPAPGHDGTHEAKVASPLNSARATSTYDVKIAPMPQYAGVGTSVKSVATVEGWLSCATRRPSKDAYAFSYEHVVVEAGRELANGTIGYKALTGLFAPREVHGVGSRGLFVKMHDPIYFTATDLVTGATLEDTLFSIDFAGNGCGLDWDSSLGSFLLESRGLSSFRIDIDSPYTVQQGVLDLEINNGVVTRSFTDGMFAGMLPAVGFQGPVALPLGDFTLDYDFCGFSANPMDVALHVDSDAGVFVAVPEPSTFGFIGAGVLATLILLRRTRRSGGTCRGSRPIGRE